MKNRHLFALIGQFMKILIIQICLALIFSTTVWAFSVSGQDIFKVSFVLDSQRTDVGNMLLSIQKQTGLNFVYSPEAIHADQKIVCPSSTIHLKAFLDDILRSMNIDYAISDDHILLFPADSLVERMISMDSSGIIVQAFTPPGRILTGTVKSSTGEPLSGASILIEGEKTGVITDKNGYFRLHVPGGKLFLIISHLGYETRRLDISQYTNRMIEVFLKPIINELNNVIVIGYGKQKAITVTGSLSSITGKELSQFKVQNVTNMLVGSAPGISAMQNSGEPGQNAASIYIRGVSTLNGTDPLIVIDGIQQPTEQNYSVLNSMDVNDIENVSILKDATATAVYGIRGANGVIIVTTKRGGDNRVQFTFNGHLGAIKPISLIDLCNSYEFASLRNEVIRNTEAFGDYTYDKYLFSDDELWKFKNNRDYTQSEVSAMALTDDQKKQLNASPALYYGSHNFYKDLFSGTGTQQQYNLNASGGNKRMKYFTSAGYYHQTGIFGHTDYDAAHTNSVYTRYNFRSNFDIELASNLHLSVNLSDQASSSSAPSSTSTSTDLTSRYEDLIHNILKNSPFSGPGIVQGYLITSYLGDAGSTSNPLGNKGGTGYSGIAKLIQSDILYQYVNQISGSLTLTHQLNYITPGLTLHATVSYDGSYMKGVYKTNNNIPSYSVERNPDNPLNLVFVGGTKTKVAISDDQGNASWRKLYLEAGINYQRSLGGGHNVAALFLANAQKYMAKGISQNTPSGLMGLVGRLTYNFKERYLFEFDLGINGTEQFSSNRQFGYFPALSAGWVVSQEPYFPKSTYFTYLKFKASYGEVGSDRLGSRRYLYLPNAWSYATSTGNGYYWGSTDGSSKATYYSGSYESALGNPDVTWERVKKTNLSAEMKFFQNRLSLNTDLFWEKRNNILVTLSTIPGLYGVSTSLVPPANIGKISNHGIELQVNWRDQIGQLNYWLKASYSFARNKIDYEAEAPYAYSWMDATGFSVGQYKGFRTNGFYNTQEELNNRPYDSYGNNIRLGDLKFVDINGDGIIDDKDKVPIGYANLPEVAYNFSIGFSYKNFDLSALIIGTAKGSFPLEGYFTPFNGVNGAVLRDYYNGHWTAERYLSGKKITYPERSFNGQEGNEYAAGASGLSDFWLRSSDFMRLKNIEVGYSFSPLNKFYKIPVKTIRIFFSGNNIFTWGTHNLPKGIDPELSDSYESRYGYTYPLTRTYTMGVNVQF